MNIGRVESENVGGGYELNGVRNGAPLDRTVMLDGRYPGWMCYGYIWALAALCKSSGEIHGDGIGFEWIDVLA